MTTVRPRDLLSGALLGRLRPITGPAPAGRAADAAVTSALTRDIARLRDAGYLSVALPREFGGLGCTLRQAACGQRRLARRAPATALAVSAHLYWTGAAADAYRCGDTSVKWILLEAAHGALFAAGHGAPGEDLKFASPAWRCELAGESGYRFRGPGMLRSLTPSWDWAAVHAITAPPRPGAVLAFAGRGSRCTPAYRVARVLPAGAASDVFTTSALGWGCSLMASVQYAAARQAFRRAVAAAAGQAASPGPALSGRGHPLDGWPVAEASLRLDAMKARIAEVTHAWPTVPCPAPDPGGQRMIGIFTMRHEIADGADRVWRLVRQITGTPVSAAC